MRVSRACLRACRIASLLVVLLSAAVLRGWSVGWVTVEAGKFLLGNPGTAGEVSPVLSALGASLPVVNGHVFLFEPTVLLWGTGYEYLQESSRAVPTQVETADQLWVLGMWIAPRVGAQFALAGGTVTIGFTGTVAFNLRIPLFALPLAAPEAGGQYRAPMAVYFFGKARFLYPEIDLFVRWRAFDNLGFVLSWRTLLPLFHAWDGESLPFSDQLVTGLFAGFSIIVPEKKTKGSKESGTQEPGGSAPTATPGAAPES